MCLMAVLINVFPDYPLICVHNREENMFRAFTSLMQKDGIIASRDKQHGGVWMGLSTHTQNILMMTNNRYAVPVSSTKSKDIQSTSRGTLNHDLLSGKYSHHLNLQQNNDQQEHEQHIIELEQNFQGFNIFLLNPSNKCYFLSNRVQSISPCSPPSIHDKQLQLAANQAQCYELNDGVHIISNGQLNDDTIWTRVRFLRSKLQQWIDGIHKKTTKTDEEKENTSSSLTVQHIFDALQNIMNDDTTFESHEWPTIEQCKFSYLDAKYEQTTHQSIFCKPYFRGKDDTDATVSQSMVIVEKNTSSVDKYKSHYFHRKCFLYQDIKMQNHKNEDIDVKNDSTEWERIIY